ncbi:hypothetical protein [Bailinhaonella thermotolerans]|uniref:Uncharacterized protein n=1 Tax=Bailinhaonella thermotolerans TaxID=1070861 RepID=A0A3A4AFX1_9ACTN|nr:hypothetical protein [Bailinhaonella thermotolerans]RJL24543.1 hypothetical protein D5H75_29990 [Bailinhaonella thermotolerans]
MWRDHRSRRLWFVVGCLLTAPAVLLGAAGALGMSGVESILGAKIGDIDPAALLMAFVPAVLGVAAWRAALRAQHWQETDTTQSAERTER